MKVEIIAQVCHEANRAPCEANGDFSHSPWLNAGEPEQQSKVRGVEYALSHPDVGPEAQHRAWMDIKLAYGWTHGPEKDIENRRHPSLLPYDQLPAEERAKDVLFRAIVAALKD